MAGDELMYAGKGVDALGPDAIAFPKAVPSGRCGRDVMTAYRALFHVRASQHTDALRLWELSHLIAVSSSKGLSTLIRVPACRRIILPSLGHCNHCIYAVKRLGLVDAIGCRRQR